MHAVGGRWLVLTHQVPAQPNYLRVKVGRRLQSLGAVALKNSVYVLPLNEQTIEDFQWVLREITAGGGDGTIHEARFIGGVTDEAVEALFQSARESDYRSLLDDARATRRRQRASKSDGSLATEVVRLRRRLSEIVAIDFFGASGREAAEALIAELEKPMTSAERKRVAVTAEVAKNRLWVTRARPKVDRIASAWLIRRFIDEKARFKFVAGKDYEPQPDELRFDMFDAEYTHEGDECTFEVLVRRFGLADAALRRLAEIVHDLDLKDGKYGRAETVGVGAAIAGITLTCEVDEDRLTRGATLLDGVYEHLKGMKDEGSSRRSATHHGKRKGR